MILKIDPFEGQHCETTATGTLLKQLGVNFSEPMLFGLGEGLSYIFWKMKTMAHPFMGGRIKPDLLTQNIARNLSLTLKVIETSSSLKAWNGIKNLVDAGKVVGLKLDSYYLEYFSKPFHFAGHYVAFYGYDEESAFLVDTKPQGTKVKTSLKSLALARSEKGPMASRNLYFTLETKAKMKPLSEIIRGAIKRNSYEYLNPPIANISFRGIQKTGVEIEKWFNLSKDIPAEFSQMAMLMEKAGTGGAIFRNLYRDFLKESCHFLKSDNLKKAAENFESIARNWSLISELFYEIARTKDKKYITDAKKIFLEISTQEKLSMSLLYSL